MLKQSELQLRRDRKSPNSVKNTVGNHANARAKPINREQLLGEDMYVTHPGQQAKTCFAAFRQISTEMAPAMRL